MRRSLSSLLLSVAAVVLAAEPPQTVQPTGEGTVVERRTWTLGAEPRLKIRSDVGKLSLEAWDRPEVELVATFKPDGGGQHVRLDLEPGEGALALRTTTPKSRSWFSFFNRGSASCELQLKVPRHTIVYARTDVGTIDVDGIMGWMDLGSDVGTITGRGLAGHDRGMAISTDVGKIRLDLKGAKGEIDARTDVGHIEANTPGLVIEKQESTLLRATLNGGKASIRLRTDVGAITLR